MKRITQKRLTEFIANIAVKGDSSIPDDNAMCYYSRVDHSYLTRVGMEDQLKFLLKKGITEQIQNADGISRNTSNIGYNPEEQKWYGWSHRAIFGFGVGSKCKKGHCGYSASNKKDFADENLRWYGDVGMDETHKINATVKEHTQDGIKGVLVEYAYDDKVPNESMRGEKCEVFEPYPNEFGKGEWEAKTLDDAKQMAIDFANGVS